MAPERDEVIIRRSNGSIDIDFYARKSTRMRREAIAAVPGILRGWLVRAGREVGLAFSRKGRRGRSAAA